MKPLGDLNVCDHVVPDGPCELSTVPFKIGLTVTFNPPRASGLELSHALDCRLRLGLNFTQRDPKAPPAKLVVGRFV